MKMQHCSELWPEGAAECDVTRGVSDAGISGLFVHIPFTSRMDRRSLSSIFPQVMALLNPMSCLSCNACCVTDLEGGEPIVVASQSLWFSKGIPRLLERPRRAWLWVLDTVKRKREMKVNGVARGNGSSEVQYPTSSADPVNDTFSDILPNTSLHLPSLPLAPSRGSCSIPHFNRCRRPLVGAYESVPGSLSVNCFSTVTVWGSGYSCS